LFAGFYSKDSIIEAVHASHLPAAGFANFAVLAGVFVTAFYSFSMYFLVFHGKERYDQNPDAHHDDHHGHHDSHHEATRITMGGHGASRSAGHSVSRDWLHDDPAHAVWRVFQGLDFVDAAKHHKSWSSWPKVSMGLCRWRCMA
jgi:NADH:ubiquinone oxidoreductase subunit 5 (subunit L)/multisubunit Na+/H+ antiporter MnhA subunit